MTKVANGSSVSGVSMMSRPGAEATDHPAMNGKLEKSGWKNWKQKMYGMANCWRGREEHWERKYSKYRDRKACGGKIRELYGELQWYSGS